MTTRNKTAAGSYLTIGSKVVRYKEGTRNGNLYRGLTGTKATHLAITDALETYGGYLPVDVAQAVCNAQGDSAFLHYSVRRGSFAVVTATPPGFKAPENPIVPVLAGSLGYRPAVQTRPIMVAEESDFELEELAEAFAENRLRFSNIQTSESEAIIRQRRGQDAIRNRILACYASRCALCDISDSRLLRASHIKGWAECVESRGDPRNVICLCVFHDAAFELGYWSLSDEFRVVVRDNVEDIAVRALLLKSLTFRKPNQNCPKLEFTRHHRTKHGFNR